MKKEILYQLFILLLMVVITYFLAYNRGKNSVLNSNVLLIKMSKYENKINEKVYKVFDTLEKCEIEEQKLSQENEIYYCLEK